VKFHQSRGAASGLLAGLLAKTDFTASADILGHPDGGTLKAYTPEGHPDAILEDLMSHWEFVEIALRVWPGGTPLQSTLTAVFDLISKHAPDPGDIDKVEIGVAQDVFDAHARFPHPKGTFEALLSFHFAVASALRDRDFWLTSVAPKAVSAPEIAKFIDEKVEFVANSSLVRPSSTVALTMRDGEKLSARVDAAKGTSGNPATLEDLEGKFRKCAAGRLNDAETSELFELIVNMADATDLSRFFALLRKPGTRSK
jgi:aconitate decarboxylase